MKITNMSIKDLDSIENGLQVDFDDFWNSNVFKSELKNTNSKYIAAKENGEIVGFAGIWIALDIAHIMNIVVKKTHRESGIGSQLLEALIKMCEQLNLKEITLEVNENNKPAISLYKKFGFKHVGTRKKYYNNEENALIYTKEIN